MKRKVRVSKVAAYRILSWLLIIGLVGFFGCGGGGGGDSDGESEETQTDLGEVREFSMVSSEVGVSYDISVGTPPSYEKSTGGYPAIFVLDGDYYFDWFREGFFDDGEELILVGINNSNRRNADYMPENDCDSDGGGNEAFLRFLTLELVPYLDGEYDIDPSLRVLFGHSHGGSFVLYAMLEDQGETFPLLLSTDPSIRCADNYFDDMEEVCFSENVRLPVTLYVAGATDGNADSVQPYMENLISRNYEDFTVTYEEYDTTHDGILNEALSPGFSWLDDQSGRSSDRWLWFVPQKIDFVEESL
jgi:predicted alpha/beta superfamily hydrolase